MMNDPNALLTAGEYRDLIVLAEHYEWDIEHFMFLVVHRMAARAVLAEAEVKADLEYERQREEGETPDA